MTRGDAIEFGKGVMSLTPFDETREFCKIAIKALEQESALDKIRAEIEQLPTNTRTNWDGCCPDIDYPQIEYIDITKDKLLSIIDKYIVESED